MESISQGLDRSKTSILEKIKSFRQQLSQFKDTDYVRLVIDRDEAPSDNYAEVGGPHNSANIAVSDLNKQLDDIETKCLAINTDNDLQELREDCLLRNHFTENIASENFQANDPKVSIRLNEKK